MVSFSRIGEKLTVQEGDLEFNAESALSYPAGIFLIFRLTAENRRKEENEACPRRSCGCRTKRSVTGALIMPSAHPATDNRGQG
ncbi:MAG: hypothetical protein R2850_04155 [Bacteroidia bacterium]